MLETLSTERGRWQAADPWESVAAVGRTGNPEGEAGIVLRPQRHVDMATIVSGLGDQTAFAGYVSERWGFLPPAAGRVRFGPMGGLVGTGRGQWLAIAARDGDLDDLAMTLAEWAAVSAQGDGRALVDIDGPQVRRMLAKVLSIDLDAKVFKPGCAATTALAHLSVQLWWREDSTALTLCASRTVAASVWRVLLASAAEYGARVEKN